MFQLVKTKLGQKPIIFDSDDLLRNPGIKLLTHIIICNMGIDINIRLQGIMHKAFLMVDKLRLTTDWLLLSSLYIVLVDRFFNNI